MHECDTRIKKWTYTGSINHGIIWACRTLQRAHETWICIKSIFLELIINILSFSYFKQDKSEKACKCN